MQMQQIVPEIPIGINESDEEYARRLQAMENGMAPAAGDLGID